MRVEKREFSKDVLEEASRARDNVRERYGLEPGNNIFLVCQKLCDLRDAEGVYAECGVFRGNTFFTAAEYMRISGAERHMFGFDSFRGFPAGETDTRDMPGYFRDLLSAGMITEEHYRKAAVRTKDFTDTGYLESGYFLDVGDVFRISRDYAFADLVEGAFGESLRGFNRPVAVLFLDCDLYKSYMECLENMYPSVVPGGAVIFDEYYSLKYPGARLAVNEFFRGRPGRFEGFETDEGFERWCFVKPPGA